MAAEFPGKLKLYRVFLIQHCKATKLKLSYIKKKTLWSFKIRYLGVMPVPATEEISSVGNYKGNLFPYP